MKKIGLSLIAGLLSFNIAQAAETGIIKIKLETMGSYKTVLANELHGIENKVRMTIATQVISADGKIAEETFGPIEVAEPSTDILSLRDNSVISNDLKMGNIEYAATITNEEIRVSKEELLRVTQATLQKKGEGIISKLNLMTENAKASFEMNVTDLVCQRDLVTKCSSTIEFIIEGAN